MEVFSNFTNHWFRLMHLSQNSFDHKNSAGSHKYLTTNLYNLFTLYTVLSGKVWHLRTILKHATEKIHLSMVTMPIAIL